jgi:DNA-binding GntR family transcriptional regulator
MAAVIGCPTAIQPRELTELRLLLELPALRKLADRGLSDQELAVIRKLADATMRSARSGDVLGYPQADMVFHLYLLELTGDPGLSEVARVLLARGPMRAPRAEESGHLMAAGAREHYELVNMLTDDMVSAADDLLRHHVSRLWVGWPAPARGSPDRNPPAARGHDMADRMTMGKTASATAEADLDAFIRHGDDVPIACHAALISSLGRLRGSDDPVVTFAGLPGACVPEFADGCQVELSDGTEPLFRVTHPASSADGPEPAGTHPAADQMLLTPVRVVSRTGYPSYAGVVTHWWTSRAPSESDAAIADLMVKHVIALVDHERLMAAVARAEDRAASLVLEAISGRTINLATGIVMRQKGLAPDDAEDLLRQSARMAGTGLAQAAASVVRSGALADSSAAHDRPGPVVRDLVLVPADVGGDPTDAVSPARRPADDGRRRRRSPHGNGP